MNYILKKVGNQIYNVWSEYSQNYVLTDESYSVADQVCDLLNRMNKMNTSDLLETSECFEVAKVIWDKDHA